MIQKLRHWLKTEKEKLSHMTWRQRGEYIWMYYSWTILITLAVIAMGCSLISSVRQNSKEVLISGMLINAAVSEEGYEHLGDGYWAYCGSDSGQRVDLVETRYVSFEGGSPYASEAISIVEAMVTAKSLDYILVDRDALDFFDRQNIVMDLRNVLTGEQLERYATVETENGIIGLELGDTAFAEKYGLLPEQVYFMAIGNAPDVARITAFADYLLSEE